MASSRRIIRGIGVELRTREIERNMMAHSQHAEVNPYTAAGITPRDIIRQCDAAAARGLRPPLTAAERRKIERWTKRSVEQFYPTAADMGLPVSAKWSRDNPGRSYHSDIVMPAKIRAFRECNINIPDVKEKQWCQDLTCNTIIPSLLTDADVDAYILTGTETAEDVKYCKTTHPTYTTCINPQFLRQEYPESDFITVDNAGKGNCFFLAVMTFVQIVDRIASGAADIVPKMAYDCKESMDYRNNAVDWLVANQNEIIRPWVGPETIKESILGDIGELYDRTLDEQNKAFAKYIRNMRKPVEYAGQPEWLAISRVLGRTIMVFGLDDSKTYIMRFASIIPGNSGGLPIYIKHMGGSGFGHYVAMIPKAIIPAGVTLDRTTAPSFTRPAKVPVRSPTAIPIIASSGPPRGKILIKGARVAAAVPTATPTVAPATAIPPTLRVAPRTTLVPVAAAPAPAPAPTPTSVKADGAHAALLSIVGSNPKSAEIINAIFSGKLSIERCMAKAVPRGDKPTSAATGFLAKELIDLARQLGGSARKKEDACAEIFRVINDMRTA